MKRGFIVLLLLLLLIITVCNASAGHIYKEREYQKAWCEKRGGIIEYRLDDGTRVDCLLPEAAVEFDFAPKWADAIGQALYYGLKTNRAAAVVLIIESEKDKRYLARLAVVTDHYNIIVWTLAKEDLKRL